MKKVVLQYGNSYEVRDREDMVSHEKLPAGTYILKYNKPREVYYLERVDDFVLPDKIYGTILKDAERIISTFLQRPLATGVLMTGVKGSGKTLLAKTVSDAGLRMAIPTIIVNQDFHGEVFNAFIQSLEYDAIILFDEFDKTYKHDTQQSVLTLFDGTFPTRKLFVVTANKTWDINQYLLNRPGRMYYNFKFDTLSQEAVREYCEDNIQDEERIEEVVRYSSVFSFFNFDMLSSAVEEMNRYGEPLATVMRYLNIEPEMREDETYTMTVVIADESVVVTDDYHNFSINDFRYHLYLYEFAKKANQAQREVFKAVALAGVPNREDWEDDDIRVVFESKMLSGFDRTKKQFTFRVEKGGHAIELKVQRNRNRLDLDMDFFKDF